MVSDDMLAFIAHNFYVQEHCMAKFKAANWEHVDEQTKNLYLFKAMDAISKWKQRGMSLSKIQNKLLVKEKPDDWPEDPLEDDRPLIVRVNDHYRGFPLSNDVYEEPPF